MTGTLQFVSKCLLIVVIVMTASPLSVAQSKPGIITTVANTMPASTLPTIDGARGDNSSSPTPTADNSSSPTPTADNSSSPNSNGTRGDNYSSTNSLIVAVVCVFGGFIILLIFIVLVLVLVKLGPQNHTHNENESLQFENRPLHIRSRPLHLTKKWRRVQQ